MRIKYFSLGFGALVGTALLVLTFLLMSPDENYKEVDFPFEFEGITIAGKLILPLAPNEKPIDYMIFVHGDGAMPHDAFGYFVPYFSYFAQNNMCALSWDKPGVNGSDGDWLDYSMKDRAALVVAAIAALRSNIVQPISKIGVIGFSQAGWVLPKVDPNINEVAFYIFVSPAINWMRQSAYMSSLRQGDMAADEVTRRRGDAVDDLLLSGALYAAFEELASGEPDLGAEEFSKSRWNFVVKNAHADLTADLGQVQGTPVLLLAGARDGQVDALETIEVFKEVLGETNLQTHVFEKAGHSMLEVDQRRPMQDWDGIWIIIKTAFMGRDAFIDGYWAAIDDFVAAQTER